jgi:CRP-like cAMP-binding protein
MLAVPKLCDLARLPLFAGLTEAQLGEVGLLLRTRIVGPNTPLLSAQEKATLVYFVSKGTIKICSNEWGDDEVIIAILGAGEMLGEIHCVDGLGHSADAVTLERCELLCMEGAAFQHCCETMPALNSNLLRLLARRARFATARLQVLATKSMSGRLAFQLLSFAQSCGSPDADGGTVIPLRLTQTDLASLIGASRQHTNRIFNSFKDLGYLNTDARGRIVVFNRTALERCE